MSRARKLVEGAFKKVDEITARADARAYAKLTPAERERYDYWQARGQAARHPDGSLAELEDARLAGKVLHGPAGEVVHGVVEAPEQAFLEDPAAWEEQRKRERAARDEIRAQYLAPNRRPVRVTRVATRGKTQLREVADHLASSGLAGRPDLVYGAYRVPDLISPSKLGSERGGMVEWDILHAAEEALPPAQTPSARTLAAKDVLVARRPGEPAPVDEDLALHLLAAAGIGPEQTLGIARDVAIAKRDTGSEDNSMRIEARVEGVHLLATRPVPEVSEPLALPEGPPEGIVVDVLQWDAIAVAVHPLRQHRAPLPSPFPYLPLTPQELLTAYLEIVGVSPADAYSAQVTHHGPFDLMGRTSARWGVRRTGGGPDLPSADGRPRQRMAGGHHIVVAYRDTPAYVEGRARFDAYAVGELQAHLRRGLNLRAAVPKPTNKLLRTIDRVGDAVEFLSGEMGAEETFVAPRYCWPPRRP